MIAAVLVISKLLCRESLTKLVCSLMCHEPSGKSTLMVQSTALVRAMAKKLRKRVIITRNISNEGDSRVPFR